MFGRHAGVDSVTSSPVIPIALCHGLLGYDELRIGPFRHRYWNGIDTSLRAAGHPVLVTKAFPTAGIVRRATELKVMLERQLAELGSRHERIILIAHSMGGLDARYLVSRLGFADRVAAIVTVCTPHRGSPFADFIMEHMEDRWGAVGAVSRMGLDLDAGRDLTTVNCRRFNDEVPDAPGVAYFSVNAARPWHRMPFWAMLPHRIIADREGPNDGLVSLTSSVWGEHLGTWNAHHWHAINRRKPEFGPNATGDIAPFYVDVVRRVCERLELSTLPMSLSLS